jgi:cobalt/nickel transport system permease protein
MKQGNKIIFSVVWILLVTPQPAFAMHIMEGYLSPGWALLWAVITLPFLLVGIKHIRELVRQNGENIVLIAMATAYVFMLSALKIPSLTGSCSHPTGVGLGAILLGPWAMSIIGVIVLLFQAILLAHGGLSTLGANTFSMAIVGPFVAIAVYHLTMRLNGKKAVAIFMAAMLGNLATYCVTAIQLALAWPSLETGVMGALIEYLSIFAITQIPLALSEGILTVLIYNTIEKYLPKNLFASRNHGLKEETL